MSTVLAIVIWAVAGWHVEHNSLSSTKDTSVILCCRASVGVRRGSISRIGTLYPKPSASIASEMSPKGRAKVMLKIASANEFPGRVLRRDTAILVPF